MSVHFVGLARKGLISEYLDKTIVPCQRISSSNKIPSLIFNLEVDISFHDALASFQFKAALFSSVTLNLFIKILTNFVVTFHLFFILKVSSPQSVVSQTLRERTS